jgi:serine/threonine protein kinase
VPTPGKRPELAPPPDESLLALLDDFDMPLPISFGRYVLEQLLGRGGMGVVYLAHDTQLDRKVALKVPRMSAQESPTACERFLREARAAATLEHPNICPVYDVGQIGPRYFITMAFIEGQILAKVLRKPGKSLTPRQSGLLTLLLSLAI